MSREQLVQVFQQQSAIVQAAPAEGEAEAGLGEEGAPENSAYDGGPMWMYRVKGQEGFGLKVFLKIVDSLRKTP